MRRVESRFARAVAVSALDPDADAVNLAETVAVHGQLHADLVIARGQTAEVARQMDAPPVTPVRILGGHFLAQERLTVAAAVKIVPDSQGIQTGQTGKIGHHDHVLIALENGFLVNVHASAVVALAAAGANHVPLDLRAFDRNHGGTDFLERAAVQADQSVDGVLAGRQAVEIGIGIINIPKIVIGLFDRRNLAVIETAAVQQNLVLDLERFHLADIGQFGHHAHRLILVKNIFFLAESVFVAARIIDIAASPGPDQFIARFGLADITAAIRTVLAGLAISIIIIVLVMARAGRGALAVVLAGNNLDSLGVMETESLLVHTDIDFHLVFAAGQGMDDIPMIDFRPEIALGREHAGIKTFDHAAVLVLHFVPELELVHTVNGENPGQKIDALIVIKIIAFFDNLVHVLPGFIDAQAEDRGAVLETRLFAQSQRRQSQSAEHDRRQDQG